MGCREPGDDYSLIEVNGHKLNQRTLDMLEYAYSLYGGSLDIRGPAITQGSYTNATEQSYGSHGGGGAVDLRVYDTSGERWVLLEDEIEPLIRALRLAGFAAWYRPSDYLSQGSPAHIHAIAVGDEFLSGQALTQLDGACGYFRGYAGWPIPTAECQALSHPWSDIHGGPIVCDWMCKLPYASLAESGHCQDLLGSRD